MGARLKICGLMRPEDVALCCEAGADMLGFVTEYPHPVPWNLTRDQTRALLAGVRRPARSCVVTGGAAEAIIDLALTLLPDAVQLHAGETLQDTAHVVQAVAPRGIRVIKTLPMSAEDRLAQLGQRDPARCAALLVDAGVSAILVDSRSPTRAGGPGQPVDLDFYRRVQAASPLPVILAGGVTPENAPALLSLIQPPWLDVMTGVETAPGRKDPDKVRALAAAVRAHADQGGRPSSHPVPRTGWTI